MKFTFVFPQRLEPALVSALMLALSLPLFSATPFVDQLSELKKAGKSAEIQKLIKESYETNKGDPEYFIAAANYWWTLSQEVSISTKAPEGDDFAVADQKTGKAVGSISSVGSANPEIPKNAIALLEEGLKKNPYRFDIAVGLAYMLREQNQLPQCSKVLKGALATAVEHPEKLLWKEGKRPSTPLNQFVPVILQGYTSGFYNLASKEGDQLCRELCEAIIKAYPDHPYAYNIMAALSSAGKDETSCVKYLLIAHEKAPADFLIMLNLGDAYKRLGDKPAAKRYLEKVLSSKAPEDLKDEAKKALEAW